MPPATVGSSEKPFFQLGNLPQTPNVSGTLATPRAPLQFQPSTPQEQHPLHQLQSIKDSFDASSPLYKFKHIFYNVVDPADIARYQRPANIDDIMWQQAVADNPNPTWYADYRFKRSTYIL